MKCSYKINSRIRVYVLALIFLIFVISQMQMAFGQTTQPPAGGLGSAVLSLITYSTIHSIGMEWNIAGDTNHNAKATAQYRQVGTSSWRQALPLFRIDVPSSVNYGGNNPIDKAYNMLAGSIMFLNPGTAYEVQLNLQDPDGGSQQQTFTISTRQVPALPTGGRTFHVVPGSGGGDGSASNPFKGIASAQAVAQAGDIFLLHAGSYAGTTSFNKAGALNKYVVWKPAGDGAISTDQINIQNNFVWVEGFTGGFLRSSGSIEGAAVIGNRLDGSDYLILLQPTDKDWYITDNLLIGSLDPLPDRGYNSGEGVELNHGSGHVVAYNRIYNTADGVSYCHRNCDIYGNDISDTTDDGIEPDYGYSNIRIWGNRVYNIGYFAFSFQPQYTGPWYFIRNQAHSYREIFKMKNDYPTDHLVTAHNTFVGYGSTGIFGYVLRDSGRMANAFSRNNLWIAVDNGPMWGGVGSANWKTDLNYDGFDTGVPGWLRSIGQEANGITVTKSIFQNFNILPQITAPSPAPMLSLKAGAVAIDAGVQVPNINDPYVSDGKPDLGALEFGKPLPSYGPRTGVNIPIPTPIDDTTPPTIPSGLSASPFSSTRIDLLWNPSSDPVNNLGQASGVAGYKIFKNGAEIATALSAPYSATSLTPNTTYSFSVAAIDAAGLKSAQSQAVSATTKSPPTSVISSAPGLVGYWKFDDQEGNMAFDSSGNENHGILTNNPKWTTGKIGGALSLDGLDDYVLVGSPAAMNFKGGPFSVFGWMYSSFSYSGHHVLAGRFGAGWFISRYTDSRLNGYISDGIKSVQLEKEAIAVLNNWNHIGMVYNGAGTMELYANGKFVSSTTGTLGSADSGNIYIGALGPGSNVFNGIIDDVRIYNRALSSAEIQSIFNEATTAATPAPAISFSANPTSVTSGSASTLTWSSTNANSCTASGGWTGAKATSGTQSVSPTSTTTYTLNCSGAGGSGSQSTAITVQTTTGNVYYVATNGSDANTCTQAKSIATPKRTPAGGVSCLASGDTLFIRQGTYTAPNANSIPSGTSWTSATKIASYPGEKATLTTPSSTSNLLYFFQGNHHIILDGLILDGVGQTNGVSVLKIGDASHHVRFINGEIKNAAGQGVLTGGAGGNEFINCKIHDTGKAGTLGEGFDHGLYIADIGSNGGLIENCDIYDNTHGFGIHGYGGATYGYVIRNNRIWNSRDAGILLSDFGDTLVYNNIVWSNGGGGIKVRDANNKIYNNIVYNTSGYPGIWVMGSGHRIENNIVFKNSATYGGGGIYIEPGTTGVTVRNNLAAQNTFWGSSSNYLDASGNAIISGNLFGDQYDPKFVNAGANDFHLQSTSPAINSGTALAEVTKDFDGVTRPQGSAYDIGAYEFGGGVVTDTTPPTISSVTASSITSSSATITWATNEMSTHKVDYGTTTSYGSSTTENMDMMASHSVTLNGLNANTLYHYRVKSRDAAGNPAASGDFTFTTSASTTASNGDVNGDNKVDIYDIVFITRDFGKTSGYDPRADIAAPFGIINLYDIMAVVANWGKVYETQTITGNVYYVSTIGNDTNTCVQAQGESTPKRTIGSGAACLGPGDILRVKPGVYNEGLRNNVPGGTSWSNPVTIQAYDPNNRPVLRPTGDFVVLFSQTSRKFIVLDGLDLDGVSASANLAVIKVTEGANSIRLKNSIVRNSNSGHGILISHGNVGGSNFNEIINNKIYDNGFPHSGSDEHGIYVRTSSNLIEGNEIYNNWALGVHQFECEGCTGNIYRKNIFRNNVIGGQIGIFDGDGTLVYNNLFYDNPAYGINIGLSNGTKIYNNALYKGVVGIWVQPTGTNTIIKNNILYDHTSDLIRNDGTGTVTSNNLLVNPLFVDAANKNFAIQSGSAARDAGITLAEVTTDYAGITRPQGSAYDIGAYEYGGTPTQSTTTGCPGFIIEGFGKGTTGGCGGPTTYVTSLANSGPGTLREALTLSRPRIIKFAVSGTMELTQDLGITGNDLTIDGSDAPNGGIAIKGATTVINTGGNIIIRHIRFRLGPNNPNPNSGDSVRIGNNLKTSNIVLDHVSAGWSTDGNIDIGAGVSDVTIQNSIITEGLRCSTHYECPHSTGMLISVDANRVSLIKNLWAHNFERLPAIGPETPGIYTYQWINNFIYNPERSAITQIGRSTPNSAKILFDSIGNFYKKGPGTASLSGWRRSHRGYVGDTNSPLPSFYVFGNIDWGRTSDAQPQTDIIEQPLSQHVISNTPHVTPSQVASTDAFAARDFVLANAGANLPCRDSVDRRVVNDAINGTGNFIDNPSEVGGWPDLTGACSSGSTPTPTTVTTSGNVYYVATNGNDVNSCADAKDINKPKKTINAGIGCLASGDTLLIRGGTYAESIYKAPIPNGISWDKATKIARYQNEVVALRPPAGCSRVLYLEGNPSNTPQYMIFDGLVIDAINCGSDAVKLGYQSGGDYPYTPHHIRIINSEIMNSNDMGILGCGASPDGSNTNYGGYCEIINNKIHDIGDGVGSPEHGVYITGPNNLFEGNEFYNIPKPGAPSNNNYGIHIWGGGGEHQDNNIVRYNKVHDVLQAMIISKGDNNQVYYNLVYNTGSGISVHYFCANCKVFNNVIYNGGGIALGSGTYGSAVNTIVRNNIIYPSGGISDNGIGTVQSNNFFADPKFVNAAALDFHLQSNSPAINAGTNVGLTRDFDGNSIVGAPDIGAYEYTGGLAADTTPPVITSTAASSITSSSAIITWTTNENADTQVEYGTAASYGSTTSLNTTLTASHKQSLNNLQSSTLYHYRVKSRDAAGNPAASGDFTFTTSAS